MCFPAGAEVGWAKRDNGGCHFFPILFLSTAGSSVAAFAEAWDYDDEKMFRLEKDPDMLGGANRSALNTSSSKRGKPKTVGVLGKNSEEGRHDGSHM